MRNPQLNGDGTLQHLLTIEGLPREVLVHILDTAASFIGVTKREVKKVPLLRGRQQRPFHALVLEAQHHYDVTACEPLAHVVMHGDAELLHARRQQRPRADHAHVGCAEGGECVNQRARHA